jgi:hypothetical protein
MAERGEKSCFCCRAHNPTSSASRPAAGREQEAKAIGERKIGDTKLRRV